MPKKMKHFENILFFLKLLCLDLYSPEPAITTILNQ